MVKGLKLNYRKFWGLISTFVEVAEEKLVETGRGGFLHTTPIPPSWVVSKEIDFLWDLRRTITGDMFMQHKFVRGYPERFLIYAARENPNNLV